MAMILVLVGVGAYFLLRRTGIIGTFLVENPLPGALLFAAAWAGVITFVLRFGARHKQTVVRLGATGPWALFSMTMPAIGGLVVLATINPVGEWLRSHETAGVFLYAGAFALLAGFALLPTYSQAVLGGWAFGVWVGIPAALAGFLGGSLIGYVLGRRASGDRVMEILREHPKWAAVRDELAGSGFWRTLGIVALVRIPPNSPFAITNLVMASVKVPLGAYAIGTLIGMSPRTAAAVFIATQVQGALDASGSSRPQWYFIAGIVSALIAIAVIGQIATKAMHRVAPGRDESGT
jgi:uncharacterized membrane protein YdjX (TVP38/TMEM64 family)